MMMRLSPRPLATWMLLAVCASTTTAVAQQPEMRRENTEWCDFWMPNTNQRGLPRVMLIGDSITKALFPTVEQELQGKAFVARLATSKAVGDPALLQEVALFLGQANFDVVHFNVGMHGWDYSEQEYRQHLPALIAAIRKSAPGAKLMWGQTTPIRKDREKGPTNERIRERNRIAAAIMEAAQIPVDDLHALMSDVKSELHSDDIHFNKEANVSLGQQVARSVAKLLSQP